MYLFFFHLQNKMSISLTLFGFIKRDEKNHKMKINGNERKARERGMLKLWIKIDESCFWFTKLRLENFWVTKQSSFLFLLILLIKNSNVFLCNEAVVLQNRKEWVLHVYERNFGCVNKTFTTGNIKNAKLSFPPQFSIWLLFTETDVFYCKTQIECFSHEKLRYSLLL